MVHLKITPENASKFNKVIIEDRWIVLYHWKSCSHCIDLLPIWNSIIESEGEDCLIADIEYDTFNKIDKKYTDVKIFPTIVVYENGLLKENFKKKRTVSNLKQFLKKNKVIDKRIIEELKNKK